MKIPKEGLLLDMKANEAENEKNFWKAMNDHFGFWLTLGGLNPRGPQVMNLLFLGTLTSWIFLLSTAYHVLDKDLGLLCESLHFIVFITVSSSFWISFVTQKETVFGIYKRVGEKFYDYKDTLDKATKEECDVLLKDSNARKQWLLRVFSISSIITYFIIDLLRPVLKYTNHENLAGSPEDGMHTLLPVTFWLPIRTSVTSYVILFLLVEVASINALGIVVGHNIFFLVSCEECSTQCSIIGLTLKRAKRRARSLSMPPEPALRLCLQHSIKHHQLIIKVVEEIEKIVYYPAIIYIVCSAFLLCVSGFLIITDKIDMVAKISFTQFLLSELLGILVYCYYGEKVTKKSSEIYNDVYFGDWIEDTKLMKNYTLLIQSRTYEGLKISAGGFMYLNLETYKNALSSAFSYFNILNALNS